MLKNAIWLFIFASVLLMMYLPSFNKLQDLRKKNIDLETQIQQLKHKNVALVEEKRRLLEDPVYLEKIAREKMGIAREGESVINIIPAAAE